MFLQFLLQLSLSLCSLWRHLNISLWLSVANFQTLFRKKKIKVSDFSGNRLGQFFLLHIYLRSTVLWLKVNDIILCLLNNILLDIIVTMSLFSSKCIGTKKCWNKVRALGLKTFLTLKKVLYLSTLYSPVK